MAVDVNTKDGEVIRITDCLDQEDVLNSIRAREGSFPFSAPAMIDDLIDGNAFDTGDAGPMVEMPFEQWFNYELEA